MVKPRVCAQQQKLSSHATTLSDHEHMRYRVVPAIDNYEQLKRTKMKAQLTLDDKRQQWMQANAL